MLEAADTGPATDPARVESPASHGLAGKSSPAHCPLAQSSSITKPSSPIRLPADEFPEELLSSTIKASSPVPHSSTVAKHQSDATTTAPTNIVSGSKNQVQEVSPVHHIAPITQRIHQISPPPAAPLTKPSEVASANKLTTGPRPAAHQSKGKSVSAEKEDSKHSSHLH